MMKKWLLAAALLVALTGCKRYEPPQDLTVETEEIGMSEEAAESVVAVEPVTEAEPSRREPVQVKGIYLSAPVAGNQEMMDNILAQISGTEINTVVIDLKDDNGRVTCPMDSVLVTETEASLAYVSDMPALIQRLKDQGLYVIARVVAFRDPWLAEKKPEWCLKLADGSVFRDRSGLAWINPYKQEVWDYLVEIGTEAARMGFDEVQFDYIRFCTERGVKDVVFEEADTRGRSKTDVITEFTAYAYERLSAQNLYVAADVFGAIIGSEVDSQSVGQIYGEMAQNLDYICPMIYPSHYGDGNFGIEHPDMEPYRTILAALQGSSEELAQYREAGKKVAVVRPWLQDFTASYLKNYITYGSDEIRAQIQATYDAGYDEWMLWSAACRYTWDGLKTKEEAAAEWESIQESRAAAETAAVSETGQTSQPETEVERSGPAPEISSVPELPDHVDPAGSQKTAPSSGESTVIPQMQME